MPLAEEEQRLLQAVLDAPADDEPRLVYADWLMERGDPRGELVVVQCTREACERAGQRATKAYRAACARERALLAEHTQSWVDPIGLRKWWGDFSRGFITTLTISPAGLRAKWKDHFSRMPLQRIKLQQSRARRAVDAEAIALRDLSWLAAQPESNRLEIVVVDSSEGFAELDWQALRPVLAELGQPEAESTTPTLVWQRDYALPIELLCMAVRSLSLSDATSTHIADLNLRAPAAGIQALHVHSAGQLDASDLALLFSMPQLRGLRELSLTRLDDATATRTLEIESNPRLPPRFPHLRKLTVTGRGVGLGTSVARALGANRVLQTLESLRVDVALDENLIGALDAKATRLQHLIVDGPAKDYALDALARSALIKRLTTLSLIGAEGGTLGPPSIMPLLREGVLSRLSSLSLHNFLIGDANAQAAKNASSLSALVELKLSRCGLTEQRTRTIASSPYLEALTIINFALNELTATLLADLRARWPDAIIHF